MDGTQPLTIPLSRGAQPPPDTVSLTPPNLKQKPGLCYNCNIYTTFANHLLAGHWILLVSEGVSTTFVEALPDVRNLVSRGIRHVWRLSSGTWMRKVVIIAADDHKVIVIND